jgi:uncharacterized protein (TIGR01244 family)
MFIRLDDRASVAPQIDPADVAAAKADGFVAIINNRPDGEAPDQPTSADIAAAAGAAGLAYHYIPMGRGGLSMDMIDGVREAMTSGRTLLFCRSGTRSTMLWALASAAAGGDPDELADIAAAAGYDVSPVMGAMRQLAAA